MDYLFNRHGNYYYRRRVPKHVLPFETRSTIKISLGTKDLKEARRKAAIYNDYIEEFWRSLVKKGGSDQVEAEYKAALRLAEAHGFVYKSAADIAKLPLDEVVSRVSEASRRIDNTETVEAVLGGKEEYKITLSECLDKFWELCADRLVGKTDHQIRKWENPRRISFERAIEAMGDKPLSQVTRDDVLKLRSWWNKKISSGDIQATSANKSMMQAMDVMKTVALANNVDQDWEALFAGIRFKEIEVSRPSFEADYVQNVLLKPSTLASMNDEARFLVYAMADTGAREAELIGLTEHDIFLNDAIPYIWIRSRPGHSLKTSTSERKIPLVGSALYAFKQLPKGFHRYKNADSASSTINKYFREYDLKPSSKHTLYSLRHTFKDRLRDAGAPEEVIDELMGHKKFGPKYGRGHILDTKYKWLKKVAFKVED